MLYPFIPRHARRPAAPPPLWGVPCPHRKMALNRKIAIWPSHAPAQARACLQVGLLQRAEYPTPQGHRRALWELEPHLRSGLQGLKRPAPLAPRRSLPRPRVLARSALSTLTHALRLRACLPSVLPSFLPPFCPSFRTYLLAYVLTYMARPPPSTLPHPHTPTSPHTRTLAHSHTCTPAHTHTTHTHTTRMHTTRTPTHLHTRTPVWCVACSM